MSPEFVWPEWLTPLAVGGKLTRKGRRRVAISTSLAVAYAMGAEGRRHRDTEGHPERLAALAESTATVVERIR